MKLYTELGPYKDHKGTVEYCEQTNLLHGKIVGTTTLFSYEARDGKIKTLIDKFKNRVDKKIEIFNYSYKDLEQ